MNGPAHSHQVTYCSMAAKKRVKDARKEDSEAAEVTEAKRMFSLTPEMVSLGPLEQQLMSTAVVVEVTGAKKKHCQRVPWLHYCCQLPIKKRKILRKRSIQRAGSARVTRADME